MTGSSLPYCFCFANPDSSASPALHGRRRDGGCDTSRCQQCPDNPRRSVGTAVRGHRRSPAPRLSRRASASLQHLAVTPCKRAPQDSRQHPSAVCPLPGSTGEVRLGHKSLCQIHSLWALLSQAHRSFDESKACPVVRCLQVSWLIAFHLHAGMAQQPDAASDCTHPARLHVRPVAVQQL